MAITLPTPVIAKILPFDPTNDYILKFTYSGNQIYKNRVVIKEYDTNKSIYDLTLSTMKLEHLINANTLVAGNQYIVQIQVFDIDNNSSQLSSPVLFYCLTTPQFSFSNLTNGEVYRNASKELKITYSQLEGENLRSYQYMQYSIDKTLIKSSDVFYSNTISPYTFYNLENNTVYYFRAIGETVNGIQLDTGYIEIDISYKTMPANIIFDVKNNYCEGYITLNSGIKTVEYEFENDNYVLEDDLLKMWDNSLTYKNSFSLDGDFVLFIEARKLPVKRFLTTNNNELNLSIVNICDTYYCKLDVKDSDMSLFASLPKAKLSTDNDEYLITDNEKFIEIINTSYDDEELIVFEVKRIGHLYSIKAYYKAEHLS